MLSDGILVPLTAAVTIRQIVAESKPPLPAARAAPTGGSPLRAGCPRGHNAPDLTSCRQNADAACGVPSWQGVGRVLAWVFLLAWPLFESPRTAGAVFRRGGVSYALDTWDTDHDLPQSSVLSMVQSRQGYLWLGTLKGLVRFDGHQFTVLDTSNTPELPSSRIFTLFEDSRSDLWLGTETSGAALISGGRVLPLDFGRGSREARVIDICEDASGAVWLLGADGHLARHREGRFDVWNLSEGRVNPVRSVIPRQGGSVWIGRERLVLGLGTTEGLDHKVLPENSLLSVSGLELLEAAGDGGYWQLAGRRVQRWGQEGIVRDLGAAPWSGMNASAFCEDAEGNPVIGTVGEGVYWYDSQGQATRLSRAEGLANDYVYSLLLDRENNLWIGTDGGGLVRVKRLVFDVVEATRGRVVQSVSEGPDGTVWVGYNGGGVDRWENGKIQRLTLRQGGVDLSVRAILSLRDGSVWAGTWGGLFQLTEAGFVRAPGWERLPPVVHVLHEDDQGRLWVGTSGGLLRRDDTGWAVLTVDDGLTSNVIRALANDGRGGLWIGTEGGGVCRLSGRDFESWRQEDGVPGNDIVSLWVDDTGQLWAGISGRGLARFDGREWTHYTVGQGLVSNSLSYLLGDDRGGLWIGSNAGIMRVALSELNRLADLGEGRLEPRVYRRPDGLPTRESTEGSQPGAWLGKSGRLWLSTSQGLASVDPGVLEPNPYPPPTVIESVEIDGHAQRTNLLERTWADGIRVAPDRERIEIRYTSLNLRAPDRARFRYRMVGHETQWTEAGDSRVARYAKLPPGEYRFEVRASNEDGLWNEVGSALTFWVQPPFWRTWWFLGGATATLLAGVVGLVYYLSTQRLQRQVERLRQQQALERERARIARDLHDQLGASLTQISLLGEMAEADKQLPDEVESYARQITQTSRDTTRVLDEIVWAVNPSNDTLEGLITYFCKNAQEYLAVAGVRVRLEMPANLPGVALPPEVRHNFFLAAKEAVTNVVRHAQASEARIRLKLDSRSLCLEIEDNGRGLGSMDRDRASQRNGLRNMRKRMEDIGGAFEFDNAERGGAVVRLRAPCLRLGQPEK